MSEKRLLANRENAQRSTGPRTAAGKKRSSLNATKHGAYATILIDGESAKEQKDLLLSLYADYSPVGLQEQFIVSEIADTMLRKRRYKVAEAKAIEAGIWADFGKGTQERGDLGTSLILHSGSNGPIATCIAAEASMDRRVWMLFDRLERIQQRRKSSATGFTTGGGKDV